MNEKWFSLGFTSGQFFSGALWGSVPLWWVVHCLRKLLFPPTFYFPFAYTRHSFTFLLLCKGQQKNSPSLHIPVSFEQEYLSAKTRRSRELNAFYSQPWTLFQAKLHLVLLEKSSFFLLIMSGSLQLGYKLRNFVFYSCSTIWCICTVHLLAWLNEFWEICSTLHLPWISSI